MKQGLNRRIVELFAQALELEQGQRAAFLAQACAEDRSVRAEVESLLGHHDSAEEAGFLEEPPVATIRGAAGDPHATRFLAVGTPAVGTPTSAGLRFRILRPHAKGGLGQVSVAVDEELHREVALKEIQDRHADDPASRARFLLEAELTGGLEHPGVVPVYGLGQYADGRPFYAMRFIRGDSLQDAVERFHQAERPGRDAGERTLALRQLLGRFVAVCNAVAYAHSRGVLHRDLKPNNVMLGKYGETLVVDWGLAKLLARTEGDSEFEEGALKPASASSATPTQLGSVMGSPPYMSPEQAAGSLDQLGPASDVYSLGATLYCLLTGRSPFEERDVVVLLQKVQRGEFLPPRQVQHGVPPALEAVCLKAMALRPEERYATALKLAEDVEHWLADEPVSAYREPWTGRVRRWGRRHRPLVAAAGGLLLTAVAALVVGIIAIKQEKDRTEAARQQTAVALEAETRAREDEATARQQAMAALRDLTDDVVEQQLGRGVRLTEEAKAFLRRIMKHFESFAALRGERPESRAIRAEGHFLVGFLRRGLGELNDAEAAYREAVGLWQGLAVEFPDVPVYRHQLARIYINLGSLLKHTGRPEKAEAAYRDALALYQQLTAEFPDQPNYSHGLASIHNNLANLLKATARPKEAEEAYREAHALHKQLAAKFPNVAVSRDELATSHNNLANLLRATGRPKEAEEAYRDALVLHKQLVAEFPGVPGYRHKLGMWHTGLGNLLAETGRFEHAEAAFREALVIQKQLAADFPAVPAYRQELSAGHNDLGVLLKDTGRLQQAEGAYRDALAISKQLAADFPNVPEYINALADTMSNLAGLVRDRKDFSQARDLLEGAGPHHQATLNANPLNPIYRESFQKNRTVLASVLAGLGDHARAVQTAEQLAALGWDPAADAYAAACALAQCISVTKKDAKLSETQRQELVRSYADRALAMLRQAVSKGYKGAAHMKKNTDLDPLRPYPEFQKLLTELEAKAKPAGM